MDLGSLQNLILAPLVDYPVNNFGNQRLWFEILDDGDW